MNVATDNEYHVSNHVSSGTMVFAVDIRYSIFISCICYILATLLLCPFQGEPVRHGLPLNSLVVVSSLHSRD